MQRNGKIPLTEGKKRKGAGIGWEKMKEKTSKTFFCHYRRQKAGVAAGGI